ncbi:hypothetical protein QCA50_000624 [Cerrena zonata]|uniref:C2H2-type domain-containing protein n=1 Tax=Cerrena zonata TaxID=2478898 RepID=A0AAW0GVA2_9APHY
MLQVLDAPAASTSRHFTNHVSYADNRRSRWRQSSPYPIVRQRPRSPSMQVGDKQSQSTLIPAVFSGVASKAVAQPLRRTSLCSNSPRGNPRDLPPATHESNTERGHNPKRSDPVCDFPTASYKWNPFGVSRTHAMYVNYSKTTTPAPSLSFTTRRSPSVASDASPSLPTLRLPPLQSPSSGNPSISRPIQSRNSQERQELNLDLRKLEIKPDEVSSERGKTPSSSRGARSDSRGSSVASPGSSTSPLPSGESGWIKHARPAEAGQYMCIWKEDGDPGSGPCGYSSKKHLVKRHIESKHLNIRRLVCHVCGKGFSQKSNFQTHMNTHTGDAPHKCSYCDKSFGDPARRHRHMKADHGHVSSRRKRQGESGEASPHDELYYSPEEEESDY